jgi:hypothetical protein
MANTLKQGVERLKAHAGTAERTAPPPREPVRSTGAAKNTVLIGGHFPRAVRRSLAQLQADPRNDGKKLNDLLAEALNDLFAKYDVPQTAMTGREPIAGG